MSLLRIRLHAIVTGYTEAETNTPTPQEIADRVKALNEVYEDAHIVFDFDPGSDVERSTDPLLADDAPLDSNGQLILPLPQEPQEVNNPCAKKQQEYAASYQGQLVVYFRTWRKVYEDAGFSVANFSAAKWTFVRLDKGAPGVSMAHEIGHYLDIGHTFSSQRPETIEQAADMIKQYVEEGHPRAEGLNVFDGDAPRVLDTPPDMSEVLFEKTTGAKCGSRGSVCVPVTFTDGQVVYYSWIPDRANIMSYYGCPNMLYHLSSDQITIVRDTIVNGCRSHLQAATELFDALWEPGSGSQSRVFGWSLNDFANQFNAEIAAGRHAVHVDAYRLLDGQIRYNGVWEPGNTGQTRALCWAPDHFAKRFDTELAEGKRLVHMQAYDVGGGQIRYDGVWEDGNTGQTWALCWALDHFAKRLDAELAAGKHLLHMQAYDVGGGQIRYDGVWENGNTAQTRALCWALDHFAKRFDTELAAGKHLVHMQAYDIGGGQIRYDGVWENGNIGQTRALCWAFNHFVERFDAEVAGGKHLVHMQAYDIGGGDIRYDGVWSQGPSQQTRGLGLTFWELVARHDQEAADAHKLIHLQGYIRGH
jgi:Polyglycine hydrolase-like, structural repeat